VDFVFDDDDVAPNGAATTAIDTDRILAAMAMFMIEGHETEEARLALESQLTADEWAEEEEWGRIEVLVLRFRGPRRVYDALESGSTAHRSFSRAAEAVKPDGFDRVCIMRGAAMVAPVSADWRNELLAVLDGRDIDNQAIGHKAALSWNGLRFRSQSEVRIAQALDDMPGVMFLPNCKGRVGSKDRRRNLETDFIVMYGGVWGVLEVDGPHHEGKAAHDHERDRPLHHHGAAVVQRYESLDCFKEPEAIVLKFMALLKAKAR
jgi:hypothetical protein